MEDKIKEIKVALFDIRSQLDLIDRQKEQYIQLYNSKIKELEDETKKIEEAKKIDESKKSNNSKNKDSDEVPNKG